MPTDCNAGQPEFEGLGSRKVTASFDGGTITSNAGALLLREAEQMAAQTGKQAGARELYEKIYCARGEMENRIKECQLDLFGDRTSTAAFKASQLRLWFASLAYVLVTALRRLALAGTELEHATAGTIRLKLLKLGALVTVSVRRIEIAIAPATPLKPVFAAAQARLCPAAA